MKKLTIGGMATFKGVLLRSNTKQVITSKNNNIITSEVITIKENKNIIKKIPIIRGIVSLFNSIKIGSKYITKSAEDIVNKITKNNVKVSKLEIILGYIISFILFILIYLSLPVFLSNITDDELLKVIIQLGTQIGIFIIYILLIGTNKYFKNLFIFHGAEHTVINFYEHNYNKVEKYKSFLDIDFDEVKKYSKFHKRCGSNYITLLFILTLVNTLIIPSNNVFNKILFETISLPLLVGLAFELLLLSTKFVTITYSFFKKFMIVQNITTNVPTKEALEIATISLLEITNKHIKIKGYIDEYLFKYDIKKYDIIDIYELIEFKLKVKREDIISNKIKLNFAKQYELEKLLNRYYLDKTPIAYITNEKYFYKEKYFVNENVLIPRSDTELIVDNAIKIIKENKFKNMLDLCCGSGCIGISISKNSDIEKVTLSDISNEAIKIANKNIKLNKADKCKTINSDLFKNIEEEYDLIISNPPYIRTSDLDDLDEYVKKEPILALDGGVKGLDIYVEILNKAKTYLKNKGYLILEIGYDQKEILIKLINIYPYLQYIDTIQDYGGNDRVVICRLHQQ